MSNQKNYLILGFSPGLGVFLNSMVKHLHKRGFEAKLVDEITMSGAVPRQYKPNAMVLAKIIEYENTFYNPENNLKFRRQIENYAIRCLYHLDKIINQSNVTDLVVWNGLPIFPQAGIHWAREKRMKIWYMENGALPGTLQLDNQGVNFASSITDKDPDFFTEKGLKYSTDIAPIVPITPPSKLSHSLEMFMRYINRFGWYWSITRIFWKNFLPDQRGKSLRKNLQPDKIQLPDKFVFIPLQVQEDTQILMYSPLTQSLEEFVEISYKAIKQINSNMPVVVKEHPQDFGRHSYEALQKKYPDIIWLKNYPINDILSKASLVITINSGVGIEALSFYRPVITLGKAFYNIPQIVRHAEKIDDLPMLINDSLSKPVNKELISSYLGYLQSEHLIRGGWKRFSKETLDDVTKRLTRT